jgi:hypothetical protein
VVTAPESADITDITCQPGNVEGTRTCDTVYEIRKSPDGSRIYVEGPVQRHRRRRPRQDRSV